MNISRVLVANRGEIARRVFQSAKKMGLSTIAIHSDGDEHEAFVSDADFAFNIGGTTATESYLDMDKVLNAAIATRADAIHPGYGFLSENAEFAEKVQKAGITWVGPPPEAISAMGDKLAAKRMMVAAGVPTLPSAEIDPSSDLTAISRDIGFPLLVKASAGGGGKGMRVVETRDDLEDAIASSKREASAAFGNDTVFLERYLPAPRHVEIQVLGDQHGNVLHCFERECSIQRRHQKVIEEAPSPAMSINLRQRMGAAAVTAVEAMGYYSVGTVEFLLDGEGDEAQFFFLEINTRLQVEHPVTEAVTGIDLVREQILVAAKNRLSFTQSDLSITGHAIEARLYAEDPSNNFLPATGTLHVWKPATEPKVRFDSGIEQGSVVSVEFDPMLAKVIAHAPTRTEASLKLALALERTHLHGVTTNRDFLVSTLRSEEFLAGKTTTDFIERVDLVRQREAEQAEIHTAAISAALLSQAANRTHSKILQFMPSGFRNSSMPDEEILFNFAETSVKVTYRRNRNGSFKMSVDDGQEQTVRLLSNTEESFEIAVGDMRWSATATKVSDRWYIDSPHGGICLVEKSRFPELEVGEVEGGLVAPMPGKILALHVANGDQVKSGQVLVLMEAMKMEHQITAPLNGTVTEVLASEGDQVDNGQLLVVVSTEE